VPAAFFNVIQTLVVVKWENRQQTAVLLEAVDIKESVELGNYAFLDVFGHKRHKLSP